VKDNIRDSYRTFRWTLNFSVSVQQLGQIPINQDSSSLIGNHDVSSAYVAMKNLGHIMCMPMGYSPIS